MARKLDEITLDLLPERFHASVHDQILTQAERDDVTHIVVFENQDFCSSAFGQRSAVAVGPGCNIETLEQAAEGWLNDLPSQRQYPVAYAEVEDYHGEGT